MTDLKAKQKSLLIEWKMVVFELERRHSSVNSRIKMYQISDDLITKHKNFMSSYAKAKQNIEKRFHDSQYDPPDDAVELAKKELTALIEQEEEFAEYAKLKDKQQTLIDEWKMILFELDRNHCRYVNQLKFCQLSDDLAGKHKDLLGAYDQTKQDIEKRFNDPQYDPPIDALETARKEVSHQIDREVEFAALARLKDKQKTLLDEWKFVVAEFDQRHDLVMNRPMSMCNYLKRKHDQLLLGYVQAKQSIERRFENPQYNPPDDALETAKKVLTIHLEKEEGFVDHVQE
ncbi:hypothetical protein HA402_001797 [Bradysia odoriphaga]|nr:hypothetical protein HA402_001797 [Bradysia odoriphaga]